MSRSLNKVQLIGNVGQDPEIRFTQDGRPIANLSLATSETWNDKQGQRQEQTEWHRVVVFGKLAEVIQQYVRKGSKLFLEGKLQTRKWTDNQGQDRYTTEIVLGGFDGNMIMLDGRPQGGGGYQQTTPPAYGQPQQQQSGYSPQPPPQQQPAPAPNQQAPVQDFDDDIPF